MEKNTLRKRRFLCFDLTPRWKMWKRIEDLEARLATCLCERNEADGRLIEREHEVLALTQARDTLYKRLRRTGRQAQEIRPYPRKKRQIHQRP